MKRYVLIVAILASSAAALPGAEASIDIETIALKTLCFANIMVACLRCHVWPRLIGSWILQVALPSLRKLLHSVSGAHTNAQVRSGTSSVVFTRSVTMQMNPP